MASVDPSTQPPRPLRVGFLRFGGGVAGPPLPREPQAAVFRIARVNDADSLIGRVLVVEDDEDIADVLRRYLTATDAH